MGNQSPSGTDTALGCLGIGAIIVIGLVVWIAGTIFIAVFNATGGGCGGVFMGLLILALLVSLLGGGGGGLTGILILFKKR